jgi:succinate dehydrogenase/fumarate reductase flavoprotein subunit
VEWSGLLGMWAATRRWWVFSRDRAVLVSNGDGARSRGEESGWGDVDVGKGGGVGIASSSGADLHNSV